MVKFSVLLKLKDYVINKDFIKKLADNFNLDDNSFEVHDTKCTINVNDYRYHGNYQWK